MLAHPLALMGYSILGASILAGLSSLASFSTWVFMEVNFMALMAVILPQGTRNSTAPNIAYFLVQGFASAAILMSIAHGIMAASASFVPFLFFLVKLGSAPVHFWLVSVIQHSSWHAIFLFSAVQKAFPLIFLSQFESSLPSGMLNFAIVANILVAILSSLNLDDLKLILAFSSVFNTSWFLISLYAPFSALLNFFGAYALALMLLTAYSHFLGAGGIGTSTCTLAPLPAFFFMALVLSVAGFPPSLLFWAKIELIFSTLYAFPAAFVLTSAGILFLIYIRSFAPALVSAAPGTLTSSPIPLFVPTFALASWLPVLFF
uniref:NADH-ubiquinone oxidoreductase chain 2 n=1 Tax=Tigriopus kingsejongensis TaxID=1133412 RepID=A0A650DDZ0_9MAXI|nr:NADH dehydrogenase subunit 2 [Tigriopus kingsejongensis]